MKEIVLNGKTYKNFEKLIIEKISWMDEWRLEAGDDWRGDIGEGIMAAKVILFIISPKSVEVIFAKIFKYVSK